jgi:hypothetical protein
MGRKPDEEPDLKLAEELIFAPRGLTVERFSHAETVAGRTPDFRVWRRGELVAYTEVKSPRDDWLDDQLDVATPMQVVGGLRQDPTFNRIARHVEKTASQFDAVNPNRDHPNILVFVNHDKASNFNDLRETLTGMFHAEGGERFATMMHISEGRLGDIKKRIDLYAWIDARKSRIQGHLFNEFDPSRLDAVCELFRLDKNKIKR